MAMLTGVFIALGIIAYVILWRYIFLQFFKLVKPSEDSQDSPHDSELSFFAVFSANCSESSDENHKKFSQIVANISPQTRSIHLSFALFSSPIQSECYVIRSNSLLRHRFSGQIDGKSPFVEEVEHFNRIHDAHKFLKLCLLSASGRCGKSILTKKDKSGSPKLRNMELVDGDARGTQGDEDRTLKDNDVSFSTFETLEWNAMPSDTIPEVQLERQGKDLNTMIRHLVAAELMKCCEKECGAISRAHSDTNNRVNWKRNKYSKQAVNSHANPPSIGECDPVPGESTCDSCNLESVSTFSNLSKKYDDILGKKIGSQVTLTLVTEDITENDQSYDSIADNDERKVEDVATAEDDTSISCSDGYSTKKLSETENGVSNDEPETQIELTREDTTLRFSTLGQDKFGDASTQTEHMYMIRAVRSCPGRKRRLQLLGTARGMSKAKNTGKIIPIEICSPAFLYRKASDNLIYEMGKGSRSPSYIPVPERFRWRYVTPTKVN